MIQSYCISPKVYESLNIPQQTQNSEQKPYTAMLIIWHFLILSMKTSFPSIGWGWSGWQCEYVNTSKAIRNLGLHKLQETSFLLLLLSNWTPAGRRVPQNHVFDWLILSFNRSRGYLIAPPGKFWIFYYYCFLRLCDFFENTFDVACESCWYCRIHRLSALMAN